MNFLQVIHFFPALSAQAFKPCGKVLKDIMFCITISGGGDETQTRFSQQVAGCDQIVTARGDSFRRKHGEKETGDRIFHPEDSGQWNGSRDTGLGPLLSSQETIFAACSPAEGRGMECSHLPPSLKHSRSPPTKAEKRE